MGEEARARRDDADKLILKYFGCSCSVCRFFVGVGIVAIEPWAGASRLHEILKKQNWVDDDAVCERASCGVRTYVTRDRTILGGKAKG